MAHGRKRDARGSSTQLMDQQTGDECPFSEFCNSHDRLAKLIRLSPSVTLLKLPGCFSSPMPLLPLRLLLGWLLVVGPVRGWTQGVPHPALLPGQSGPTLPDLTARAAAIFEGRAVAYRAFESTSRFGGIYTVATVEVYKVFKGAVAATVEVVTEGGTLPNGRGGGLAVGGVPIFNNATGVFFAVPFHDAAHVPRVSPAQVYRVVDGAEGLFLYSGWPPQPDAADTPWVRYAPVETALYPLLTQYTGVPYRVLQPFDVRCYDKILERRTGVQPSRSHTNAPAVRKKSSLRSRLAPYP